MPRRDHFIVERYLAGEIVHYDLPLNDATVSLELNKEIVITGVLESDFIRDVNQGMGLFPYNDCIHWVHDGVLRGGALIQPLSFDDQGNVLITARGWSTMLDVPMINGMYSDGRTSAQTVVAAIINYVNNNILDRQIGFFHEYLGGQAGPLGGSFTGPPNSGNTGTSAQGSNQGLYYIAPWEAANALEEIRTISEAVPYDIEEFEEWDGGTNNIKKTLKFHLGRMGAARRDLRFVEGENILNSFAVSTSAEDYANAVLVIGAGEGSNTIMAYKYLEITNTARRVHVIDDDTIYNLKTANAIANLELAQRSQAIHVGSIIIDIEHPNAPLGSLRIGDDIRVDAVIPFLGRQVVWHRIIGITYRAGATEAELTLARSDSFNYLFSGA